MQFSYENNLSFLKYYPPFAGPRLLMRKKLLFYQNIFKWEHMNGNIPQSSTPASANTSSAGTILGICSLILFIAGIALSFIPAIGIFIAIPFFVIALILSILAIVRGATVFGIIMLCATVLLSGPTACFASCVGNAAAMAAAGSTASGATFNIEPAKVRKELQLSEELQRTSFGDDTGTGIQEMEEPNEKMAE